jgi:hypothetical protein
MPSPEPAFPPTPDPLDTSATDPTGPTSMSYDLTDPSGATTPRTGEITITRYDADGERIDSVTFRSDRAASMYTAADGNFSGRREEDDADQPHIIVTDPGDSASDDDRKE